MPKAVLRERLTLYRLNVARVRALCMFVGYDPEIDNFDQTPFHANESGSQNTATLAVAGTVVPVVEGHADTRERWTLNLFTLSSLERLQRHAAPHSYCECLFKASGESLTIR